MTPAFSQRLQLRLLRADDDLQTLTHLIRAAYANHQQANLRFWATHQTVADTASRFAEGQGLIAELMTENQPAQLVGTLLLRRPQPQSEVSWYRDPQTWSFGQFAVDPHFKGQGIGEALHQRALEMALAEGARYMALDTAAPASRLIALYQRWGYEVVGEHDWRPQTNYLSLILRRQLI